VRQAQASGRYAERTLDSVDDGGAPERIVLWIERKDGGAGRVAPFTRKEIVPKLERLFFRGEA
jgi:hypothetical protein